MTRTTLLCALCTTVFVPLAGAQTSKPTNRAATVTARAPLNSTCASLLNTPTELVRSPEGVALLRFKRELDGVATVISARGDTLTGVDLRRFSEMRRDVDSLMQVLVRAQSADGTRSSITIRAESTIVMNGRIERLPGERLQSFVFMRPNVEVTLRAMEPEVSAMSTAGARLMGNASSTGYLGVTLSGSQVRQVSNAGSFVAHCEYPMIEAVDVGSPARRAGLAAGDTVLSYNGRDIVAQPVNYAKLLTPGAVVRVKVRRDGKARDIPVTIETRSPSLVAEMAQPSVRGGFPVAGRELSIRAGGPAPASAAITGAMMTSATMLGAQLNTINGEFAETLGVEAGLLVMRVQAGSPFAEAGIRAGEVIRAVNGMAVRDLLVWQRLVSSASSRELALIMWSRESPSRAVTLRW